MKLTYYLLQFFLKTWLCDPQTRKNDVCIVGKDHQCNGIEVEVVVHLLPADCPLCGISNADPVIVSRAKAMVIISTYQRLNCTCGWKNENLKENTPSEYEGSERDFELDCENHSQATEEKVNPFVIDEGNSRKSTTSEFIELEERISECKDSDINHG